MNKPRGSQYRYELVAVGGTFDILHSGHFELLSQAFSIGRNVLIGVSSDSMVSKLGKAHPINSYSYRGQNLRTFLRNRKWSQRARIVKIEDPFGPALRRKDLDALIVSQSTKPNAIRLNLARRENGLKPLKIHVVKLVMAENGKPISVTRIRRGLIDKKGKLRLAKEERN